LGAEQPEVLRQAHSIVVEQLARLRALAEDTRRNGAVLGVALRQAERLLDEALVQQRSAVQWRAPAVKDVTARVADLRAIIRDFFLVPSLHGEAAAGSLATLR